MNILLKHNLTCPLVIMAVALMLLIGCASDPPEVTTLFELPESFSQTGKHVLPEQWWHDFNDPVLNEVMALALSDNFSLRATWDRLAQAEAIARREGAATWPDLDLTASVTRKREDQSGQTSTTNSFIIGLAASYELDLWGRVRSTHRAAGYDVQVSAQDLQAAAISLTASVANTWYQLAEQSQQVQVINEQLEANRKLRDLVMERFRQGQVQAADVLRQRQLVESSEGLKTLAELQLSITKQRLAVLLGRPPESGPVQVDPQFISLPDLPDTGLPAALIERRPDVRRAYLNVLAKDQKLAAAIAEQFPRISITASVTTSAAKTRDLFDNWLASLAGNLAQPIFDADRLGAEADRNRAVLSEAINTYRQVVLDALKDVEAALVTERSRSGYLESLRKQLSTTDAVIERTYMSYMNGQLDYIRVLESLTSRQSLQRQVLTAERQLIESRIQLCRALAGPLPIERPEPAILEPVIAGEGKESETIMELEIDRDCDHE